MSNYYEPKDISRKIRMEFLSAFAETKKLTREQVMGGIQISRMAMSLRLLTFEKEGLIKVHRTSYRGETRRKQINFVEITEYGRERLKVWRTMNTVVKNYDQGKDELVRFAPRKIDEDAQPCGMKVAICHHSGCYLRYKCTAAGNQ